MCNSATGISKGSEDKQVPVDWHDKVDSNLFYTTGTCDILHMPLNWPVQVHAIMLAHTW